MGTNCDPLLTDKFLHSEENSLEEISQTNRKTNKSSLYLNVSSRYVDGVFSLNNAPIFDNLLLINPIALEMRDTIDFPNSVSCLDIYLELNNREGFI